MKDEIHFTSENGFSPCYLAPNGTIYFIADERVGNKRKFKYTLKAQTKSAEFMSFDDRESLDKYIEEQIRGRQYQRHHFSEQTGYFLPDKILSVEGHTVKILYKPVFIEGPFDSYQACLEFAKKLLGNAFDEEERIRYGHIIPNR